MADVREKDGAAARSKESEGAPEEFELVSPADGIALHAELWPAIGETAGVVCLVHGMGEHQGRLAEIIKPLRQAGFIVFAYDQRGHGRSAGRRGHSPSISHLTRDAEALLAEAERRYPALPIWMYGHSMGGCVVANFALRHESKLAGIVLTSPWLRLSFQPPKWKVSLGRAVSKVWPTLTQSANLEGDALFRQGHPSPAPAKDEWSHGKITAAMFTSIEAAGEWAIANAQRLSIPVLLLHGTADRITSFEASKQFAHRAGAARCSFVPIEGGYHELHHDPEGPETMRLITQWLREQAAKL